MSPRIKYRLQIVLVPATAPLRTVRTLVSAKQWAELERKVFAAAGGVCEVCGGVSKPLPVELVEDWNFRDSEGCQELRRLQALCSRCKDVRNIGEAAASGRIVEAIRHFGSVNGCGYPAASAAVRAAKETWVLRNALAWTADLQVLANYFPFFKIPTSVGNHIADMAIDRANSLL